MGRRLRAIVWVAGALAALGLAPLSASAQVAVRKVSAPQGPATIEIPQAGPAAATAAAGTASAPPASAPSIPAPSSPAAVADRPVERGSLSVTVDRAKIIRLPDRTQTVVVGNPSIADLAIQKNGIVVVTGKSFGVTNVIALDSGGNVLAESSVSVNAPTDSIVTVQRGDQRQSFACTPSCMPSVQLGDSATFFNDTRQQAEQRSAFATSR